MGKGKGAAAKKKKASGRVKADRRPRSPSPNYYNNEVASEGAKSEGQYEGGAYKHMARRGGRAQGRYYGYSPRRNEYGQPSHDHRSSYLSYNTYETTRSPYARHSSTGFNQYSPFSRVESNHHGTQWKGAHALNFATGFASGARKGIRREGRENPTAPRGVGRIGRGPVQVPAAMVAAAKAANAVPPVPQTKVHFWDLVSDFESALENLAIRSHRAVRAHDPRGHEDQAYEDALERCESMMRALRRWKYVYIEDQGRLRCNMILDLGSRLNGVIADNIRGCVIQAKEKAGRRRGMVSGNRYANGGW